MDRPPVSNRATARTVSIIPNVMMNGCSLAREIPSPLSVPIASPTPMQAKSPRDAEPVACIA